VNIERDLGFHHTVLREFNVMRLQDTQRIQVSRTCHKDGGFHSPVLAAVTINANSMAHLTKPRNRQSAI
jgi:hypothetical protein